MMQDWDDWEREDFRMIGWNFYFWEGFMHGRMHA